MKKIIAYSLWGDNPKYTEGAVINAIQAQSIYPGWTARFYCGSSVSSDICRQLRQAGAELVLMDAPNDNRGMFWRFLALADPETERVIFRDTDSRLSQREREAVRAWEQSGLAGHIMRDHPYHCMPIMGGMWGCAGGVWGDIRARIAAFNPNSAHNQDQLFLEQVVYPELLKFGCCVHDTFFRYEAAARPFPTSRQNYEFVGEVVGADGQREDHWQALRDYENSPYRRCWFGCKRLLLIWRLRLLGHIG